LTLKPRTWFDWLLLAAILFVAFGDRLDIPTGPTEICAVTIEESADATTLTMAQVEALNSPKVAAYMQGKGYPFNARIDPDMPNPPAWITAAIAQVDRAALPALVVFNKAGRLLHNEHVAGPDDVLPVLKKFGGA
jgi:hypothetical protein